MKCCGIPIVIWFVIVSMGCDNGEGHLKRKISAKDLVGIWQLTSSTKQLLGNDGFAFLPTQKLTLTLNSDGSLVFASILDNIQDRGSSYVKTTGSWQLLHDGTFENSITRSNIVNLQLSTGRIVKLAINEQNGALKLWTYYDDPDSAKFVEYERSLNQTPTQ